MAAPAIVTVSVDFFEKKRAGVPRRLKFDANAFADLEEATGYGIGVLMHREMSFALMRQFIHHGLKHDEPGMTLQRAGLLIQSYSRGGGDLTALASKVNEAIIASGLFKTVKPAADEDDDDEEDASGTADPSTARPSSSDASAASDSLSGSTGSLQLVSSGSENLA